MIDQTGLFPTDMLAEMAHPFVSGGVSDQLWLTAHHNDQPTGIMFARAEELAEGTWNMLALGVLPAAQGTGIGRALVAEAERLLKNADVRILIVDTSSTADFEGARAFYAAAGYEEEARIRDYWAAGDDKVTFRKAL